MTPAEQRRWLLCIDTGPPAEQIIGRVIRTRQSADLALQGWRPVNDPLSDTSVLGNSYVSANLF